MKVQNKRRVPVSITFVATLICLSVTQLADRRTVDAQQPTRQPRTAEQVFKNIQVVKSMPASQLQNAMSFMAASLGVDCSYCHNPPAMEKDDKATKQTARRMLVMMNEINKNFGDKTVVNCATCHRGQTRPSSIPPLPPLTSPLTSGSSPMSRAALPTVDDVLDKYVQAVGGKELDKIKTRVRKGSVEVRGVSGTFELYETAPNKSLLIGSLPPPMGWVHQGFDGNIGWVKNENGVFEMSGDGLVQTKREANFYVDTRLKDQFATMNVTSRERVGNHDVYVIEGTRADGSSEKLLFDVLSGFLIRRYWETPTFFGKLPNGIDYDNYKKVGNVRLPFIIRRSRSGTTFLQNISEIKLNVPINDTMFNKPAVQK
ncbi:MAG: photosynthetic reaction center cytochrome c subunit family protein [Acidobacteriota bacterium]